MYFSKMSLTAALSTLTNIPNRKNMLICTEPARYTRMQGEVTSHSLWTRYDLHVVDNDVMLREVN